MTVELTIKGDIEVLRLRPEDTIVVSLDRPGSAPSSALERMYEELKKRFPDNEVIITQGAKLTIQRSDD